MAFHGCKCEITLKLCSILVTLGTIQIMLVYVKLILTAIFWGGTFIAGRVVAKDVGPFSAAFFRFFIASIFLVLFTYKIEGKLPVLKKGQIFPVFLLGMTGVFLYNVFFFKGLKIIHAGRAAVIIAGNPILITLFSAYFFKEKLSLIKVIGIILSVYRRRDRDLKRELQ